MHTSSRTSLGVLAVGVLGSLLVVYGLVKAMQYYTRPAPVNAARIEERRNALAEQKAADHAQLTGYGWVDQKRGIVRLPITNAMELTRMEYRDPAAGRTNLLNRLEKATVPLAAPAAPAAPANPFE